MPADQERRVELIWKIVHTCAESLRFYVTEEQAKEERLLWPTIGQRNNNPLLLRVWGSHPIREGFVHFKPDTEVPGVSVLPRNHVGWSAARKLVDRNVFERGHSAIDLVLGDPQFIGLGYQLGWLDGEKMVTKIVTELAEQYGVSLDANSPLSTLVG